MIYALKSPGGFIVSETVATSNAEAWEKAYRFLAEIDSAWGARYWKRWEASRRSARKRGWMIVKCELVEKP